MEIAIVDDEKIWQERILAQLQQYFTHRALHVDLYSSGEELFRKGKKYDALMMDVEMPGENGIDVAERYRSVFQDTEVIILTVHLEFSMEGYRAALRFIDKMRLAEMLPAALEALELTCAREDELLLRVPDKGTEYVPVAKIAFIETEGHGIRVHMEDREIHALNLIGEIEEELDTFSFMRTHKSFLVHWKYAREIEKDYVIMKDENRVYISKRKLAEAKLRFLQYRFKAGRG